MISVCIAGATGWTGRALVRAVLERARPHARLRRQPLGGRAISRTRPAATRLPATVRRALDGVDVLIDYTSATAVKANTLAAIEAGVHVVIGSSGLTAGDFERDRGAARERSVGVVASGNFSLTAAMCQAAALLAARHLPQWEVIDYASAGKPDVPSGTARELAERLGEVRRPAIGLPIDEIHGPREARGADVAGTQVHSVRLPSFVVSTEVVFGRPTSASPSATTRAGPRALRRGHAARGTQGAAAVGLTRGLDTLFVGADGGVR